MPPPGRPPTRHLPDTDLHSNPPPQPDLSRRRRALRHRPQPDLLTLPTSFSGSPIRPHLRLHRCSRLCHHLVALRRAACRLGRSSPARRFQRRRRHSHPRLLPPPPPPMPLSIVPLPGRPPTHRLPTGALLTGAPLLETPLPPLPRPTFRLRLRELGRHRAAPCQSQLRLLYRPRPLLLSPSQPRLLSRQCQRPRPRLLSPSQLQPKCPSRHRAAQPQALLDLRQRRQSRIPGGLLQPIRPATVLPYAASHRVADSTIGEAPQGSAGGVRHPEESIGA